MSGREGAGASGSLGTWATDAAKPAMCAPGTSASRARGDGQAPRRIVRPWWAHAEQGTASSGSGWSSPCRFALRFGQRLRGLIDVSPGVAEGVFVFPDCGSVHTMGMEFAIDVLLLDERGVVVRSARQVRPRRVVGHPRAAVALEREASDEPWPAEGDEVSLACREEVAALFPGMQVRAERPRRVEGRLVSHG